MIDQIDTLTIALLLLALLLSAFFSSSETAFMSLQRVRLRHLERTGVRGMSLVRRLVDEADRTLVTILIGNNLVNTAAAALGTVIGVNILGPGLGVVVATLTVAALLLIVGEITPKTVAIRHSERMAVLYAYPLHLIARLFAPLTLLLSWFGSAIASMAGGGTPRSILSQDEIRTVILMGEEAGVLHHEATEILRNALQLENTLVRDVMVPRTQVVGIRTTETVESVARELGRIGYTRLPVYEDDLDNIVGIVHAKDLLVRYLDGEGTSPITSIMRPALFSPETRTVSSLLREIREQNMQMIIVIDEYGGTSGIVTLEDLLEEVVGEIISEYGAERSLVQSVDDREAVVDAAITIDDLNELFEIDLPSEETNTLGGFVYLQLGRIPKADDRFTYEDLEFTVLSMRRRRIVLVRIRKHSPALGG